MSPAEKRRVTEKRNEDRISFVLISACIVLGFAALGYLIMDAMG